MTLQTATPVTFIATRDRKAAEAFYGATLGFTLLSSDPFAAVYDLAGVPLRVTEIPDFKAVGHTVLGWNVGDIAATIDALVAQGVTFNVYEGFGQDSRGVWTAPGGAAKVAWFNDPDGNVLSLTEF